jgi:SAM-dependent methyltransferase
MSELSNHPIHQAVRSAYSAIATVRGGCCGPQSSCCGGAGAETVALGVGYSDAELAALPEGANLGLSCGNPTALAGLQPGEAVLDLGAGAGLDVFLAAQRVGPGGKAIGLDMTREMVARARQHAADFRRRTGLDNVEFHLGQIEAIPLPDASVDVVISNCVLNLSPDQAAVWREIARVLKPGGRVSISDMVLLRPLPEAVRADVLAHVGCIVGAPLVEDLKAMATAAGLVDLTLEPKSGAVEAMLPEGDPMAERMREQLPGSARPADYIASMILTARKPR